MKFWVFFGKKRLYKRLRFDKIVNLIISLTVIYSNKITVFYSFFNLANTLPECCDQSTKIALLHHHQIQEHASLKQQGAVVDLRLPSSIFLLSPPHCAISMPISSLKLCLNKYKKQHIFKNNFY